jgi:glycosyltransferase involved in cell wall biosynthesis
VTAGPGSRVLADSAAGAVPIWMIIPSFHPLIGGAETQVRRLALALSAKGHRVRVLTRLPAGHDPDGLPRLQSLGEVVIHRVPSGASGRAASFRYLVGGLRILSGSGRGQIYHAHDIGTPALLALLARRLFGGRSVVKLRTGASIYRHRLATRGTGRVLKALLRRHDRIIVVNSEVERLMLELEFEPAAIVRVPNAIDGDVYRPATPGEKHEARGRLGLPHDGVVVLCVGRLLPVKGIDVLLNAWAGLPADLRSRASLVVVGTGPSSAALETIITNRGIRDSVIMAGARNDVGDHYRAADLFVLPSRAEGLSNALLEAMASGLPVVATAVGGALDVIRDGRNGLLAAPEDEMSLADALLTMLTRPADWQAMGAAGRQTALDYAGLPVVLDALERVYGSMQPRALREGRQEPVL